MSVQRTVPLLLVLATGCVEIDLSSHAPLVQVLRFEDTTYISGCTRGFIGCEAPLAAERVEASLGVGGVPFEVPLIEEPRPTLPEQIRFFDLFVFPGEQFASAPAALDRSVAIRADDDVATGVLPAELGIALPAGTASRATPAVFEIELDRADDEVGGILFTRCDASVYPYPIDTDNSNPNMQYANGRLTLDLAAMTRCLTDAEHELTLWSRRTVNGELGLELSTATSFYFDSTP